MREFFNGRRRKTGIMAFVRHTSQGWVRSYFIHDFVSVPFGKIGYGFLSASGGVDFYRLINPEEPQEMFWMTIEIAMEVRSSEFVPWDEAQKPEWRWDWAGFHFGEVLIGKGRQQDYMIPYWSIVIPLTLLSAFLLLIKPRPSNPKKIVEPTPNEAM